MVAHQQKEKPCVFVNQTQQDVNHSEHDTTVTIQGQELKQGIGHAETGKFFVLQHHRA